MSWIKGVAARIDGWYNAIAGLGGARDKSMQWQFCREPLLTWQQLDDLYHGNDLARRIVSALPDDAMRQGFDLCCDDEDADAKQTAEEKAAIWAELDRLQALQNAHAGMIFGRLLGGAGVLLGTVGGGEPSMPLRDESVKRIAFLYVVDRRDLYPRTRYTDPLAPRFGEVETYFYRPLGSTAAGYSLTPVPPSEIGEKVIHESRIVMFGGALTSRWVKRTNFGWDMSVLDPVHQVLMQANANWQSVCHLMSDLSQGVFKVKGLMDLIAADKEDIMRKRMEVVDMGRSVARSLILDADGEDFERKGTPLTAVPDLVNATWQRLAAAADMPVTRLMGMSPAGLNATGDADIRNWYDSVRSYQQRVAAPALTRLVRLAAQTVGVDSPESWAVEFPSLWQMSPKEKAALVYQVAQADKLYVDMGAVLPEEVAIARSGDDDDGVAFPAIDIEARKVALKTELAQLGQGEPATDPAGDDAAPENELQGGEVKAVTE